MQCATHGRSSSLHLRWAISAHPLPVLLDPEVQREPVLEEGGEVEELGRELLDVRHVAVRRGLPGVGDGAEHAVRMVKVAALQLHVLAAEGGQAHEVVEDRTRGGVVRSVVEGGDLRVVPCVVPDGGEKGGRKEKCKRSVEG